MDLFKGYLPNGGKDGKQPLEKYKDRVDFPTRAEVEGNESFSGILKDGLVQIDVDDLTSASKLYNLVIKEDIKCDVIKTTRGMHFFFKSNKLDKRKQGVYTALGVKIDTGIGYQNAPIPLKVFGKYREFYREVEELEELPIWLYPMSRTAFDFIGMREGNGRNNSLFTYILILQQEGMTKDEVRKTVSLINQYILDEPLNETEIDTILRDESFMKECFYYKSKLQFEKLAAHMRDNDHIIKINGTLYIYDDGVYKNSELLIERRMLKYIKNSRSGDRSEILKYLDLLCYEHELCSERFIAVKNGILDLESMQLQPFDYNFIICNKIEYCYYPDSRNESLDHMLDRLSCDDIEIRMLLEEMVGYTLLRRNEMGKAFILTGNGSNGKSTFFACLNKLLGKHNISSVALEDLGHRFKTYQLEGKLANIGDDISNEYIKDNSTFKNLCTGEPINVERKGRDAYDMESYAKLIFSANELPRINDYSDGLKRRLIFIPFNAKFSSKDKDFDPFIKDKLMSKNGMEALLTVGINALRRLLLNNSFTSSTACDEVWEEYEKMNNPIISFLEEVDICNESVKDVYIRYCTWCLDSGHKNVSKNVFGREVKKQGYNNDRNVRVKGKQMRVWYKIGNEL